MFLLVCFHCFEVYAYEEGHRCTDTEGNERETDPANALLVHAIPSNRIGNRTNPLFESSSTKDFIFSVVKSRSRGDSTKIENQAKNTDVGLKTSDNSLRPLNLIPTTSHGGLVPPEQAASNPERNLEPRNLCVEISHSTSPKKKRNIQTIDSMEYAIFENSPAPRNSESEIYAASFQAISNDARNCGTHYDEAMKTDPTSPITIDNSHVASTSQELSGTVSDTALSTGQAALSLDNIPAIPGPSGIQGNVYPRIPCVENSNSTFLNKFCDTCEKEYVEGWLHQSEHICIVCGRRFRCRTQYNEHLLEHPNDFTERCCVCCGYLDKHLSKCDERLYKCCVCDDEESSVSGLKFHNSNHKPKLFCQICREEHETENEKFHNGCFPCSFCEKEFRCQPLLEDHSYSKHLDDFKKLCILCERGVHKHKDNRSYKCCECHSQFDQLYRLQNHLLTH